MEALDREVLAAIAGDVLTPQLVEEVVGAARQMFEAGTHRRSRAIGARTRGARARTSEADGRSRPGVEAPV